MSETKKKVRRYNLALPNEIYEELETAAEKQHTTILEIIRRSLKLGLLAIELEKDREAGVFIKERVASGVIQETRVIFAR